ncbi:MAG: lipid II flippase MurJ [Pseudomonadales bacterium]
MTSDLPSVDREILRGVLVVFLFAAISACAGAAKEIAIAWKFGISEVVDAYQFVFTVSQWPLALLATLFVVTIVPLAGRLRLESSDELVRLRREVLGLALILTLPLCGLVYSGLKFAVSLSFGPDASEIQYLAGSMVLPLTLSFGAGVFAVLLGGWIMADHRHINTMLQAVPALCVLLAVLAVNGGSEVLAWGTAIGFLLYALVSWAALGIPRGERSPSFSFDSPHWRTLLAGMGTLLIGQLLLSLVTIVDQFFAASLEAGSLSALGYASRVTGLVLGLLSLAIGRGMLPVLSRVAVEAPEKLWSICNRYMCIVFLVGLVLAGAGMLVSHSLVALLFERGEFDVADTLRVTELVQYAMVQVPFYLTSMVAVSVLLAQRRYIPVMLAAGLNGLLKVVLALFLVSRFGLPGLLLATAFVYLVSSLHCWLHLRFRRLA